MLKGRVFDFHDSHVYARAVVRAAEHSELCSAAPQRRTTRVHPSFAGWGASVSLKWPSRADQEKAKEL